MERLTSAPSLDVEAVLFCLDPLEHLPGATFVFNFDLVFTFFKVFEGLFLKVLEQI